MMARGSRCANLFVNGLYGNTDLIHGHMCGDDTSWRMQSALVALAH